MPEKKHHYDLTEAIEIIERLKAERDDLKSRLAQQGADKVEVQPVGYFQNVNSMNGLPPQYEQVSAVAKSEDDVFPLYRVHVAAQPDPAMAGEVSLLGAANLGLNALHECIVPKGAEVQVSDAMRALRSAINAHTDLRVQPASGEDAARLDFLIENELVVINSGFDGVDMYYVVPPCGEPLTADFIEPRAAIDNAMRQEPQQ